MIEPERFFQVGDELGASEAEHRTAINRFYYAVFNAVKDRLMRQGITFHHDSSDHRTVMNNVNRLDRGGPGPSLESLVNTLYQAREDADYDMEEDIGGQDRRHIRGDALQIVERMGGWG